MGKASPAVWVIGPVAVLLGSFALGFGIRAVRLRRFELESEVESKQRTQQIEPQPAPVDADMEKPQSAAAEQEHVIAEEPLPELDVEPREQPEEEPDAETVEYQPQEAGGFGGWREVWANLNLTEEEQARLREGLRLAWERWKNMSPEEREAETSRLREMGERWKNMSDEEKREASQRMRDRFEEWRQSGRVELPELSLD